MLNFDFFYAWTKEHLNINLEGYKEKQLQRRIGTIMKNTGAATLEEYAVKIQSDPIVKKNFLNYITINVTDFFRNKEEFDEYEELMVSYLEPKFGALKIWSAACSTGAEAYSLAMIMTNHNIKHAEKITATDIDETILAKAKKGIYSSVEIKNVDEKNRQNYFTQEDNAFYLSEQIKNKVAFKKHDLIGDRFGTGYNVIVCRNVTIYFKNEVKEELYQKFSDALVPGGLFFTGATETIYSPEKYGLIKRASFIYEKI